MTAYVIKGYEKNPVQSVGMFFQALLKDHADYIFLPGRSPYSELPMPMLISDIKKMENIEPLAPVMPFNSARQAASVLKSNTGKTIVFLLKPCEKRAIVELVKLSQCKLEDALIITTDCLGRMENKAYLDLTAVEPDLTKIFIQESGFQDKITSSCNVCTEFTDNGSDIHIGFIGCNEQIFFSAQTEKGEKCLEKFESNKTDLPGTRQAEVDKILEQRNETLDAMTQDISKRLKDIDEFQKLIGTCLNCYNCRTACPVCYCKECVFLTDIFSHMPETLLNRADKKGMIKLPTDTTMFHMTRMAHMSHACVGCGQCSSVCPSDIPVAEIFKVISKDTQDFFGYVPGKDIDENIPYLNYKKEK